MRTRLNLKILFLILILPFAAFACQQDEIEEPETPTMSHRIPSEGNSWFLTNVGGNKLQTADYNGFNWSYKTSVLRTFFRVEAAGEIHIGITGKVSEGSSTLQATFLNETKEIELNSTTNSLVFVGSYTVPSPGYYYLDLQGVDKVGAQFASIESVTLGGAACKSGVHFSNEDYFYWGRRGPSVHLGYQKPTEASDVVWFYNEITVPKDNDVIGSYYMANGFGQGYFGMQVNSSSERRVLFSVWSPYSTDDPSTIPEDQRVQLIAKGANTTTNDFGNEGSGGQSYMQFNWKAENTYKFLLKGEPSGENTTDYSAWFFDAEQEEWLFVATWRRPKISTYLTSLYSFLENFDTKTGPIERRAYYNNQWIYDTNGTWHEVTEAKFTADATAHDKARLDYAGGYISGDNGFYLKNCGFFNETSEVDTYHERPVLGVAPSIDFDTLPVE
ncbi:DUF3472 domain-containing protein [Draconibacterium sp. IB214405]|uniref:DUF3472 domain-containing protein n=1 Tax=Draconibacterium sp. IB214405 TaxID=3097352 RepID=UPI002A122434|nr:DUF3472 domain-containing protein [Draconibacterium sp. IB214405]MDX8340676.1 DUF3472 domain-containing protein [Draconibacterium sp. IB214405]